MPLFVARLLLAIENLLGQEPVTMYLEGTSAGNLEIVKTILRHEITLCDVMLF